MKKTGIYKILNKINGKFYIGSSVDVDNRFYCHKSRLRNNNHWNVKLQRAYNKSNINDFIFTILENCDSEVLLKREQHYIDTFKPWYNIAKSSSAPMFGKKHSKATIKKMSGKVPWNLGVPRTKEEIKLMSERCKETFKTMSAYKRKKWIDKIKANPGLYWKGKKLPQETKDKISLHWRTTMKKIECSNGKIYSTQLEAAKDLNVKQGHISEALKGIRGDVKQLRFRYANQSWPKHKSSLLQVQDQTGEIYRTLKLAVSKYNLNYQSVNVKIRNTKQYSNGKVTLKLL